MNIPPGLTLAVNAQLLGALFNIASEAPLPARTTRPVLNEVERLLAEGVQQALAPPPPPAAPVEPANPEA